MKKTALLFCFTAYLSLCLAQVKDPVIMNIGGKDVTKSEFEYIWNKNNTNNTADKKSLDEYLDLFINFKLKVAEAKVQGIDTTKSFKTELNGYRRQLTAPYMIDKVAEEAMYKEAYDRIKQLNEVSHIVIGLAANATPADTLKAYQKAMLIYGRAIKGEDFAKLAKENSDNSTKNEGGYLGTLSGLNLYYPFENAIFNTPVGKISKPFRTQDGYHIIKVHSRRPAGGMYSAGHILKIVAPEATPEVKAAAKDSIFKIYNAIKNGGDFQLFATKNSDDQNAAAHKGEYTSLLCGSLPYVFEEAVFKLKPGEISEPFQSKFGWHIVKAIDFQPYPDMEKMHDVLSKSINKNDRAQVLKTSFVEKLKKEYNYTENKKNLEAFTQAFDAIQHSGDSTLLKTLSTSNEPLFTLNRTAFTQKQFAAPLLHRGTKNFNLNESYNAFVQQAVMSYEDTQLEQKYPEFGHLMQEYSDGILLFEVSNREVWDKASIDTTGLKTFFNANKTKYAWDKPHYKGFIIQCANEDIAKQAKKMIKKMPEDSIIVTLKRTFNTDSTTLIKVDMGLYAQGENSTIDFLAYKIGKLEPKSDFPVVFLKGRSIKAPESYLDVRGMVISDYQNDLEQKWIETLKGKFKVIVYKDVVNTVNKN